MKLKNISLTLLLLSFTIPMIAQQWVEEMNDPDVNFYQVQKTFYDTWADKENTKGNGYKQFKRYEYFMAPRVYPDGIRNNTPNLWEEVSNFEKLYGKSQRHNKTASWRPLGPDHWQNYSYSPGLGRINNIRVDPNNSNVIYIGTPAGGCWKSTDGGQNWSPIADHLPIIGVSDIAINPYNSNEVYIATGDGFGTTTYSVGVLKSTDGGQTWNQTGFTVNRGQNVHIRRMLMHPLHPDTIWVASDVGLWRTDDGGTNWRNVLNDDIRNVKMHPTDTSIVYASTDQFYRSTDGGNFFTSSNNGSLMNLPASINRMEIAVCPSSPNVVYAVCGKESDASFYGLYQSIDAGQNWTLQSTSPNILSGDINGAATGGQSWYDLAIAVDPLNANTVFVGGVNVWRSTNGGQNWSIVSHWVINNNAGYTHADIHALDFYNNELYCGSDGGIFKSRNLGNAWQDLSAGLEITQFYRMSQTEQSDTILLGGAQDNGSLLKTDSATWAHVYGGDGMDNAIDPVDPRIMYFSSQNGNIQRSYDGGVNKAGVAGSITNQENGAWVTPFQIDPNNRFALIAAYENVWYSSNRGSSWTKISNFTSNNTLTSLAVAPSNSSVIYTAPNSNSIRKTTDFGNTWTNISAGLPNLAIADIEVHPNFPDSVWVTFSGFTTGQKVYVSGNGGSSWQNISANLPNLPVNTLAKDTATGIEYVGTDIGVYYRDISVSPFWQTYMIGLPNVIVNELEIHYRSESIRAATYGRGMWESNLLRPSITTVKEIGFSQTESGLSLYPNPSKGAFAIQDLKQEAVSLELFDLKGNLIIRESLQKESLHQFYFSNLSSGLYLIHVLKENGKSENFKLQVQP